MRDSMHSTDSNEMKKKVRYTSLHTNLFILFSFCFLLYMPKFNIPSTLFDILSYGIPMIYLLVNIKVLKKLSNKQSFFLLCIALLLFMSCLFPLINKTNDFSYFKVHLDSCKILLSYVALLCLIIKKHGDRMSLYYFMYYYILTHVIYVLVTIIMVCFPSLQDMWFTLVHKDALIGIRDEYLFRVGWQGFAGFRLTLHCTFSVIFALYLRYRVRPCVIRTGQFWLSFAGCLMGNMFYGRSGLVVTIVVSILAILIWNRQNIIKILKFACLAAGIILFMTSLKDVPLLGEWYDWMSRPIVNMMSSGEFGDSSFETLKEMNQIEIPPESFLFGDGRYTEDGHYYMGTDAGFIRNVFFWGIFGAVISYGITLCGILEVRKASKLLIVQLLIVFFSFEYKGAVYYEFIAITFAIDLALCISRLKPSQIEERRAEQSSTLVLDYCDG